MSYTTDALARSVNDLINSLALGEKSIAIKTGINGGKLLTIVNTPKS